MRIRTTALSGDPAPVRYLIEYTIETAQARMAAMPGLAWVELGRFASWRDARAYALGSISFDPRWATARRADWHRGRTIDPVPWPPKDHA